MLIRVTAVVVALSSICSIAHAQDRPWVAEVSVGYAGFVDDATKNFVLFGGSMRRYLNSRVSVGPELVLMSDPGALRDRTVLFTGNVVIDAVVDSRVKPFLVLGAGMFWGRERFPTGPYWSSDPAFTAGAGVRARLSNSLSVAADYRIGWELHQRISGSVAFHW